MRLRGKNILLGVCGGIAAYKAAFLIRLLTREGASVKVVMTPAAQDFIGKATLSALSNHPVITTFFHAADGSWNNHVSTGLWGDVFVIAPATANTLSKMASGICDNILLANYLSAKCPVIIAPAMDLDMWKHPATSRNIQTLENYGNKIIQPGTGELASGLIGEGRMAEPAEILEYIVNFFNSKPQKFRGKKVLITAGPTYEKIDPVRFIGNYSSGKMGFALAEEFMQEGANVTVVHGPVWPTIAAVDGIHTICVESAAQMLTACESIFAEQDIFIAAAAVADFAPANPSSEKIKKENADSHSITLHLKRNPDILATLSARRRPEQVIAGFALETNDAMENARKKLDQKNLDLIVLNSLQDAGAGFAFDTNKITLMDKHNNCRTFELKTKREAARDILEHLYTYIHGL
jgi:phosphopantothenoylcysteine decarboxylase/phosphopantothenate--cysteine ligase